MDRSVNDRFVEVVIDKLRRGAADYGDASFALSPGAVLMELQEEAADLAGWGYVAARVAVESPHTLPEEYMSAVVKVAALGREAWKILDDAKRMLAEIDL